MILSLLRAIGSSSFATWKVTSENFDTLSGKNLDGVYIFWKDFKFFSQ